MNNRDKAIRIAVYDGKLKRLPYGKPYEEIQDISIDYFDYLTDKYLTDLNWLITVAYKAYNELLHRRWRLSILTVDLLDVLRRLNANRQGQYQHLFDEVYAAVILIEDTVF
jgi:hypothetical protein